MKFITFAAGEINGTPYAKFGNRLLKQAQNTNIFEEITMYDETYLKNDPEFWNQHGQFVLKNHKIGYGFWLWKPYIIKKTFEKMDDMDILLYLDCCCEIDVRKSKEIQKLANKLHSDLIADCLSISPDKFYCKMDLVKYLNVENETDKRMHQAGALMLYKCDKTMTFINQWYNISCNYNLIDNSPSYIKNDECFRLHRNDQSIYSLLVKRNFNTNTGLVNCIEYIRNKNYNELCNYKLMKDKYINSNSTEIFSKLQTNAGNNDINAIFELANCYFEGYGTEANYDKSIEFYNIAATQGHTEGLYWLGMCCLFGKDDHIRDVNGIQYLKKAANLNHKLAKITLQNRGIK